MLNAFNNTHFGLPNSDVFDSCGLAVVNSGRGLLENGGFQNQFMASILSNLLSVFPSDRRDPDRLYRQEEDRGNGLESANGYYHLRAGVIQR